MYHLSLTIEKPRTMENPKKLPKATKLSGHDTLRIIFFWLKKPTQLGQISNF